MQVLGVAPRGFPLAEKSLPTTQGTCGRLSAAAGSRARALWALRVAILAPHELIVYRSFRSTGDDESAPKTRDSTRLRPQLTTCLLYA